MKQFSLKPLWKNLSEILSWVHAKIAETHLSQKYAVQFELALEEAIVNIVMHAYAQKGGLLQIELKSLPNQSITFILIDQADPFDPLSAPLKEEVPVDGMDSRWSWSKIDACLLRCVDI